MAKETKSAYKVIGVMAGSSMDGLDIAEVSFTKGSAWSFDILKSKTYKYDEIIRDQLNQASSEDIATQDQIDDLFGAWIGEKIIDFGAEDFDLIAVHGHTILHDPKSGVSKQLGNGDVIAKLTKSVVLTDFRTRDIELGGQGAPLVPVGDFNLLTKYDGCINLGGIANVSILEKRIAWDICPCNQVLNFFSKKLGLTFDFNGEQARAGKFDERWFHKIEQDPYFSKAPPKSLPNKYIPKETLNGVDPAVGLRSYSEFIARQIIKDVAPYLQKDAKVLVTGGGAFNKFLIEKLNVGDFNFHVPEPQLVEFKEAVIFGFLGVLRIKNEPNVLASVTGSSQDSSSGKIHYPK